MAESCARCGYDLSGTPADQSGMRLCPECGGLNRPSATWLVRDLNLSNDVYFACVLAIGLPVLIQPLALLLARGDPFALFGGMLLCAIIGTGGAIALAIWRVRSRLRRMERTFGPVVTAFCCALPAAVLSVPSAFVVALLLRMFVR